MASGIRESLTTNSQPPILLPYYCSQVHAPARRRSSIHAAEHGLTDVWTGDAFFKSGGLAVAALVLIALTH